MAMPRDCSRDQRGQRQQVAAFVRKRCRLLLLGAAQIDALLEIDGARQRLVEGGITRRDALHAGARILVAIGAGLARRAGLAVPQFLAVEHPQHAGICRVVALHRLTVRRHETVAGPALCLRDFSGASRAARDQERCNDNGINNLHSTVIEADAVAAKPLSPIHSNSNFPLSLATVKKVMNGLAELAGNRSARKISLPL